MCSSHPLSGFPNYHPPGKESLHGLCPFIQTGNCLYDILDYELNQILFIESFSAVIKPAVVFHESGNHLFGDLIPALDRFFHETGKIDR